MAYFSFEKDGGRKLATQAAVVACILLVAGWFTIPWFLGSGNHLAKPSTGSEVHTAATNGSNAVPAPAQSKTTTGAAGQNPAKQNPGGGEAAKQNPATGKAAQQNPAPEEHASNSGSATKAISEPINVTDAQRTRLRSIFAAANPPKVERPNFELMIGASVAEQTPLADLPPEVPKLLNGFSGDKYVVAGDELVIVDQHSHRVAAVIGDVM
jgi:hypothetical protein